MTYYATSSGDGTDLPPVPDVPTGTTDTPPPEAPAPEAPQTSVNPNDYTSMFAPFLGGSSGSKAPWDQSQSVLAMGNYGGSAMTNPAAADAAAAASGGKGDALDGVKASIKKAWDSIGEMNSGQSKVLELIASSALKGIAGAITGPKEFALKKQAADASTANAAANTLSAQTTAANAARAAGSMSGTGYTGGNTGQKFTPLTYKRPMGLIASNQP